MSIATKLAKLKTIKQDIKSALEEKGQTPSNVFSTYANNIRAIETGGSGGNTLKTLLDATQSSANLFNSFKGTSVNDLISYNDTSNVTNMGNMFYNCSSLTSIPQLDTSNVTNMGNMFRNCSKLASIPQLDTSKVTNMSNMFDNCSKLASIPQLDTINATSMDSMFYECSKLSSILQLDTSKVTNINYLFYGCSSLTSIPQLDTSKVNNISYMFVNCYKLQTIDLTYFHSQYSSNAQNFAYNCYSLTKLIIRNMDDYIPYLYSNSFTNCYHFNGTTNATYNPDGLKDGRIYVPDDKVDSLKKETNWSTYADIIVPLSELGE